MKPKKLHQSPWAAAIGLTMASSVLGGCISNPERGQIPQVTLPEQFYQAPVDTLQQEISPAQKISSTLQAWPAGPLEQTSIAAPGLPRNGQPAVASAAIPGEAPTEAMALGDALPEWWRLLGNAELNGLIDRALANSPDIHIANSRIAQAKARADQADADRYPVVTVPLKATMEAPDEGVGRVRPGQSVTSRKIFEASLRGDWRPDLWGEKASALESADLQIWRSHFQRDDVQRKLVSDIVSKYVEYLSLGDRIKVAHETEAVLSGMLASVEARMQKGDATIIEMQQQRSAVYSVKATIPALEQQREEALNAIAQLAGTFSGQLQLKGGSGLDALSYPTVTPGMPSSLLFRRPDIRVVESRLLAAGADIATARAKVLPPLDLSAQIGFGSIHLAQLLQPHNLVWNLVAGLVGTIFDKGKRDKEIEYSKAVHQEMIETYVRTIYLAMREVEDALNATRMTEKRALIQLEATDAARQAYIRSNEAYGAGSIDYLNLLDTERTYHRNLDQLHQIRMDHYKAMVGLFTALGGGVNAPAQANDTGTVVAIHPAKSDTAKADSTEGLDFTAATSGSETNVWLVELTGMHNRDQIAPLWRDLRVRYPQWMKERFILSRLSSRAPLSESARGKAVLYRLFIAKFVSEAEASEFCAELQAGQTRCQAAKGMPQKDSP